LAFPKKANKQVAVIRRIKNIMNTAQLIKIIE
jgi:hypothetical protein